MKKMIFTAALVSILSVPAYAGRSAFSFSIGYGGCGSGLSYGVGYHGYSGRVGYGVGYTHYPRPRHRAVVVQPAPVVTVVQRSAGHWEVREKKIWVSGYYEKTWVAPRYQEIFIPGHYDVHGNWIEGHHERRLIAQGYYRTEWRPGHYKVERSKVWVTY